MITAMNGYVLLGIIYCLFFMVKISKCSIIPSYNKSISKEQLDDGAFLYASDFDEIHNHSIATRSSGIKNTTSTLDFVPTGKVRNCIGVLCEGLEDYPYQEIKRLISGKAGIDIYFDSKKTIDVKIDERFQGDDGESFCATTTHSIFPEKATNLEKKEKLIINVEGYKQGVVAETCAGNSKCRYVDNLISGYTTECVQRFTVKRLMAINEDGKTAYDSFEVPSCCMCMLKKKDN